MGEVLETSVLALCCSLEDSQKWWGQERERPAGCPRVTTRPIGYQRGPREGTNQRNSKIRKMHGRCVQISLCRSGNQSPENLCDWSEVTQLGGAEM